MKKIIFLLLLITAVLVLSACAMHNALLKEPDTCLTSNEWEPILEAESTLLLFYSKTGVSVFDSPTDEGISTEKTYGYSLIEGKAETQNGDTWFIIENGYVRPYQGCVARY